MRGEEEDGGEGEEEDDDDDNDDEAEKKKKVMDKTQCKTCRDLEYQTVAPSVKKIFCLLWNPKFITALTKCW